MILMKDTVVLERMKTRFQNKNFLICSEISVFIAVRTGSLSGYLLKCLRLTFSLGRSRRLFSSNTFLFSRFMVQDKGE